MFKCGGAHFQRDCYASKNTSKQSSDKGNQSKSWSKSESSITGQGKGKENNAKSTEKSHGTKGAIQGSKSSVKGKLSTIGISGLDNLKSETSSETQDSMKMGQVCFTDSSWIHDGVKMNGMMTGVVLDGMGMANKRTTHL